MSSVWAISFIFCYYIDHLEHLLTYSVAIKYHMLRCGHVCWFIDTTNIEEAKAPGGASSSTSAPVAPRKKHKGFLLPNLSLLQKMRTMFIKLLAIVWYHSKHSSWIFEVLFCFTAQTTYTELLWFDVWLWFHKVIHVFGFLWMRSGLWEPAVDGGCG